LATVLTNVGEQWAANRLAGTGTYAATAGTHIGWGTGTTTAAKGDTALTTASTDPAPAGRAACSISTTGTGATAKYSAAATITSTTTQTIAEAGLFDAATAGNLFIHGDFTGIALASGDSIAFTFTLDPA
jgi:hypothetical protein